MLDKCSKSLVFCLAFMMLFGCGNESSDPSVLRAAKAGYEAFQTGDMEAWSRTQATDVHWKIPLGFPYGGEFSGPQDVIDNVFSPIVKYWPDFEVEPKKYNQIGNTVYVHVEITAGGRTSESIHVVTVENGLYSAFQVFDDVGFMMEAASNPLDAPSSGSHSSPEWQIAAYTSAAPNFIGDDAAVMGGNGEVLREGSNGWTCMSGNPRPFPENGWSTVHEAMPMCGDAEALKWMNAALSGAKPQMDRDSYIWMLQGDVGEDNTKMGVLDKENSVPGQWIESGPHLMLMPKDPSTIENFTDDFSTGEPYVMFPGSDYAHLMIPVTGYYAYQPESSPTNQSK